MTALIAKVRNGDRVLLGFENPENMTLERIEEAKRKGSHYYLVGEASQRAVEESQIGLPVELHYRWKFE